MDWTQENTLALIALYQKMRVLWDPNHPRYYNKLRKHDAWEDIAKTMGTVSEECKKKMTVLLAVQLCLPPSSFSSLSSSGQHVMYKYEGRTSYL